jgi:choline/glycine/proline betaine transport protein
MVRTHRKRIFGVEIEAHPIVFPSGAGLIITFVLFAAFAPGHALMLFNDLQSWIATNCSWLYIITMTGLLIFALFLCFSRYGSIRLGTDDSRPEFHTLSWFAMLFSAGMGIGMLFFGVAEPMFHFISPIEGEGETLKSAHKAMSASIFHWGLHPWALYALVALSLAYFGFRRGLPLSFRSVFYPLLGERIHGRIGDGIDIMAILATLFGLATSLGLGAKQVNAGLNFVFGWPSQTVYAQVIIIACITTMAVVSLVSGLHVGIKWLSNINMGIAAFLLLFLFVIGPTVYLLEASVQNTGTYLQNIIQRSFWTASYSGGSQSDWFSSWTVFYWGWWIAWSPFVGMFIARISKGRTLREFVSCALIVPTVVGIIWMTGFGNSAIHQEIYQKINSATKPVGPLHDYRPRAHKVQQKHPKHEIALTRDGDWMVTKVGPGDTRVLLDPENVSKKKNQTIYRTADGTKVTRKSGVLVIASNDKPYWPSDRAHFEGRFKTKIERLSLADYLSSPVVDESGRRKMDTTATAMFEMFRAYPLSWLIAILGTISVILFFVTSSDSASLVADIIASGGNENPTTGTRIFWGILEGCLAAMLLVAGGLVALQTGSITLGLPFSIIIIMMAYSLAKGLKAELAGNIPSSHKNYIESSS